MPADEDQKKPQRFTDLATSQTHHFTAEMQTLEITAVEVDKGEAAASAAPMAGAGASAGAPKGDAGTPLANWFFVVEGMGKRVDGQLDDAGHAKIERMPKGQYSVRITPQKAKPPPPLPPPPAPVALSDAGEGLAAKRRRKALTDILKELKNP